MWLGSMSLFQLTEIFIHKTMVVSCKRLARILFSWNSRVLATHGMKKTKTKTNKQKKLVEYIPRALHERGVHTSTDKVPEGARTGKAEQAWAVHQTPLWKSVHTPKENPNLYGHTGWTPWGQKVFFLHEYVPSVRKLAVHFSTYSMGRKY